MFRFLGDLLALAWHRLEIAYLRRRNARLDRRLRDHGIDPDAIPEIVELRQRYALKRQEGGADDRADAEAKREGRA